MSALIATDEIVLTGWRHHDPRVADLSGIALPPEPVLPGVAAGDVAADLYDRGARRVAVPGVVDLHAGSGPAGLRRLALVRELTSRGIVVEWSLRLGPQVDDWWLLSHLQPPSTVDAGPAGEEIRATWSGSFFLGKCLYRHGPGFIQVRDRRPGELSRLTIDEPPYLATIDHLLDGAPTADLPPEIVDDLATEGLLWPLADQLLWLPYRVRRWPWPTLAI